MTRFSTLALLGVFLLAPAVAGQGIPYDSTAPGLLSDYQLVSGSPGHGGLSGSFGYQANGRAPAWYVLSTPISARSRPGSATIGGKDFYVIGGETPGGGRADFVEIWDRQTDTWSQSASRMPIPVSNIMGSCVFSGGQMYVFGGLDINGVVRDEIQVYDPTMDSWTVHPTRLPAPRYGVGVSNIYGGDILVCGGADSGFFYGDSYIFNNSTGTFSTGPAMADADYMITITNIPNSADGKVYMTGFATDTFLQVYDTATGTFSRGPSFRADPVNGQSRAGCGMDNVGARVFIYGGDWTGYRSDTEYYDVLSGQQKKTATLELNVGRRAFAYGPLPCPGCYASHGWNGNYLQHGEGAR
ncbi:MAG: hypothetical protein DWQ01_10540 [Planctomycetota bacterium]|nr:MAG: hypothetical protein DWQ01_10540 [Planctomycetota bacterium]